MLLLSVEPPLTMYAELVPVDSILQTKEKPFSFTLVEEFTSEHQINLVVEDKQKQQAIFITQSNKSETNPTENQLID
jgi:hypothetical protein